MKSSAISFLLAGLATFASAQVICNIHCDGKDSSEAVNQRESVEVELFGRIFTLFVSDGDNMGYGQLTGGQMDDEIWVDRSFNGGASWDGPLGSSRIPGGQTSVLTKMFNVDNPSARQLGALRVCGKAGDRDDIVCTEWARSTVGAERQIDAGALALMQLYDADLTRWGWWTGANCLQAMIDYFSLTGAGGDYRYIIDEVYETNKDKQDGDYTNEYIDDTLWWGLAWMSAYDLTGNTKYLDTAKVDCDYSYGYKDSVCGGGVWWSTEKRYKAAIANELFIKLAAALHNRIPGDTKYLSQAVEVWDWFKATGLINGDNLINDGLNSETCQNNGQNAWSYNQGVILGGLVELHKATGDAKYLTEARNIVDAVLGCSALVPCPARILIENGCGDGDCGGDGPSFKGVFVRNLGELDRYLDSMGQGRPYKEWLELQTQSIWANDRNALNQFGLRWQGPFDNRIQQGNQHSAFEAFVAAY